MNDKTETQRKRPTRTPVEGEHAPRWTLDYDGRRIAVRLVGVDSATHEAVRNILREHHRHRYDAPNRRWIISDVDGQRIAETLQIIARDVPASGANGPEIARQLDRALERPDPSTDMMTGLHARIADTLDSGSVLEADYDPVLVERMRELRARWLTRHKAWDVPMSAAHLAQDLVESVGWPAGRITRYADPLRLVDLSGGVTNTAERMNLGTCLVHDTQRASHHDTDTAVGLPETPSLRNIEHSIREDEFDLICEEANLDDVQVAGVRHSVARTSSLNADDMGLGKSRQALVAGLLTSKRQLAILCPAGLRLNWRKEAHGIWPDLSIGIVGTDYDPKTTRKRPRVVICSYEMVEQLEPIASRIDGLIVDEAHQIKEYSAERTRRTHQVTGTVPWKILLTATPILNDFTEIHSLLRLGGHPLGEYELREFREQYEDNLLALNQTLRDWMVRRLKEDVLDLPGKQRERLYVEPEEEALRQYHAAVARTDLSGGVKLMYMQVALERAKIPSIVESLRNTREHAIVFLLFKSNVAALQEALANAGITCVRYDGSLSQRDRDGAVDAFQAGDADVFLGTLHAASVGLTLTRASLVYMLSLPWTPAMRDQAEDRANRRGQTQRVRSIIPTVEGTLDQRIAEKLEGKVAMVRAVLDGMTGNAEPTYSIEDLYNDVAGEVFDEIAA